MDEHEILARELAKIGGVGGFAGGLVPGAIGGYIGGKLAAKYLPTETSTDSIEIAINAADALRIAFGVLKSVGRITDDLGDESPLPRLSAVVGSGFLSLNPTVVSVTVSPIAETACSIVIVGAAKEGLIKQHTAEKAVARLKELFRNAASTPVAGSDTAAAS